MKKLSLLLTLVLASVFVQAQTSSTATFICSSANCSGGTTILSAAPTDGSTFYIVWYFTSANTPLSVTATPMPSGTSGTANIGATSITNLGGTSYLASIAASINANQGLPSVSNVDVTLNLYTAATFPSSTLSTTMAIPTATPLPVEFLDVNVSEKEGQISVNWSTASEINNELFIVEKSIDGEVWTEIGQTNGAGNSDEILHYSMVDVSVNTGLTSYYRIKQIDFDGNFDYSDIVKSALLAEGGVVLYPNPATSTEVQVNTENEINTFEVRNIAGQLVEATLNKVTMSFDVSHLPNGLYYVTVNNQVVKLVK